MPRKARNSNKSCFYHAIVQGIRKEYIFEEREDILKFKELILKKLENSNIVILAYCIMNNHAHFLVYTENSQYLAKYMQKVNTSYGRYYNKKFNRVGYVFRDRYYTQEILSMKQLYNCLAYIHNNPVKANMVENVSEYKYSSYNEYLKKKEIITNESVKLLFGSSINYEEQYMFIHKIMNNDKFVDVKEKKIEDFISEIKELYKCDIRKITNNKIILKEIIKKAIEQTDVSIIQLSKILKISRNTVTKYLRE